MVGSKHKGGIENGRWYILRVEKLVNGAADRCVVGGCWQLVRS